jgi:hypothetical protein
MRISKVCQSLRDNLEELDIVEGVDLVRKDRASTEGTQTQEDMVCFVRYIIGNILRGDILWNFHV